MDNLPWRRPVERGELPLLLVRHGRTSGNAEGRLIGRTDLPLDETGLEQARALGARLSELPIAALYSSPLVRARQTAAILGSPVLVEDLMELDQGEWEGRLGRELLAEHPDFFRRWASDPSGLRVPGGETLDECQARSLQALTSLARHHAGAGPVVVVSHQMVLATVLLHALGLPLRQLRLVKQGNTAINVLGWSEAGFTPYRLNDLAHL